MDLSMDTLHLKYPLVLFGSKGSALTLPLFLLPNHLGVRKEFLKKIIISGQNRIFGYYTYYFGPLV